MTTTQTIATSPSDTGAECKKLLQQLTDKVAQLTGEKKVLTDLLMEAIGVVKTVEPDCHECGERLAALIAFSEAAMAPKPAPDGLDFPDYHPV